MMCMKENIPVQTISRGIISRTGHWVSYCDLTRSSSFWMASWVIEETYFVAEIKPFYNAKSKVLKYWKVEATLWVLYGLQRCLQYCVHVCSNPLSCILGSRLVLWFKGSTKGHAWISVWWKGHVSVSLRSWKQQRYFCGRWTGPWDYLLYLMLNRL